MDSEDRYADAVIDNIHKVRQELLLRHGGLEGLAAHLAKLDAERKLKDSVPIESASQTNVQPVK